MLLLNEGLISGVSDHERTDESKVQGEYNGVPASQAGENSETNGSEHAIVSSMLTDLIVKRSSGRRAA